MKLTAPLRATRWWTNPGRRVKLRAGGGFSASAPNISACNEHPSRRLWPVVNFITNRCASAAVLHQQDATVGERLRCEKHAA